MTKMDGMLSIARNRCGRGENTELLWAPCGKTNFGFIIHCLGQSQSTMVPDKDGTRMCLQYSTFETVVKMTLGPLSLALLIDSTSPTNDPN